LYDFQDMLTLVAERLAEDNATSRLLLSTLRQRYRWALIDEFQDTDDVQWSIFRRIFFESRDRHVLTVIGDPKQAIYRFRGADVHTYLRAREEILGAGGAQVRLGQNFRSTQTVVDGINAIVAEPSFFRPGTGIDYRQPVTCGRPERVLRDTRDRPAPGVVVLEVGPEGTAAEIRRALRRQMVDEMRRLLSPEGALLVHDGPEKRAINAGNIFVLAFSNRECREVGDSLADAGIPHAFLRQEKLFATPEAADILDLLRALGDPLDHRLRARALLTKFFALDLPDLPLVNRPDLAAPALDHLFAWQRMAQDGDFGALFADIVARSGIACREVGLSPSERSLTNTLHILEVLQDEAAATHAGLRELAEMLGGFINGTRQPPGEDRDLQRLESDARAVQIMTVHASKGLEADVVFLYGGVEKNNREKPPYVFHEEHNQRVVHLGDMSEEEQVLCEQERADEARRLLYVALTRSRARLYLPRYPQGKSGTCARMGEIVDHVLAHPATGSLFARVSVACPGDPPLRLPPPEPADLATWQPPAPPTVASDDFRQIARTRAGFFITSYTGVKRHHGGFVVAEGPAETGAAVVDQNASTPTLPNELERGRLSGIFLHAILEDLPLDLAATVDAEDWMSHPEIGRLLDRLVRQHERDPRQLAHAARMVHTALFSPLRLGSQVIPGLGRQRPFLRETEFLYPIPEKTHPLLGIAPDDRPWSIERGLVKGFIDALFQHEGRIFLCDWKGDWLPCWDQEPLDLHCQRNYDVQARLYTLAVLRLAGVNDRAAYDERFGGVLYCFLRGLRSDAPDAGMMFRRPEWDTVLAWQSEMLSGEFWGLS
jgi:exodeoxyribonuclease V beta subunit